MDGGGGVYFVRKRYFSILNKTFIGPAFLLMFNDRFPWKQFHLQMKKVSRNNQ